MKIDEDLCLSYILNLSHINSFVQSNLSLHVDAPHESVSAGVGRSSGSDSPIPSSQQGERCGVLEDASNTNTQGELEDDWRLTLRMMDMDVPDPNDGGNSPPGSPASAPDERGEVMDIDEELVDFNDGGNHRDGEEEDGEDRDDVEEEEVVFNPDEYAYAVAYEQLLSDCEEANEMAQSVLAAAEVALSNSAAAGEDGDREAGEVASPMLASPPALSVNFAHSPVSHPSAARDSEQKQTPSHKGDTPLGVQQDGAVDTRNTSAIGVEEFEEEMELSLEGNDEETHAEVMPKVLFHDVGQKEEAEEKMSDEECKEDEVSAYFGLCLQSLSNGARCIGSCMLCVVCTAARALGAC